VVAAAAVIDVKAAAVRVNGGGGCERRWRLY
jgi:hypothetical protein